MGEITGLGGVFVKAKDPKMLAQWYQDKLGIDFNNGVYASFQLTDKEGNMYPGYNILSFFKSDSGYFNPSNKETMLNLRVKNLFEFLEELKQKNVTVVGEPMDEEYGKFGWILDPEGNKIELWEPPT